MENASRALIIAGETLIGLIVLSLIVYVVTLFGSFSSNMHEKLSEDKIVSFNQHFWECEGRINITAEEIATILNFAKQSNDNWELRVTDNNDGNSNKSVYWVNIHIETDTGIKNAFYSDDIVGSTSYEKTSEFKKKISKFISANNTKYFYCNVRNIQITKQPEGDTNGIITMNLVNNDIITNPQTKMVTDIYFRQTQKVNGLGNFTVKNESRSLYNYEVTT